MGADTLIIALGLVLVLEGLAYALFPQGMKETMRQIQGLPLEALRLMGLIAVTLGAAVVWFASLGG
tara:strand:- start:482 stop:679 length:198 start_codon:yes stop_codon:yes gene_type:complete